VPADFPEGANELKTTKTRGREELSVFATLLFNKMTPDQFPKPTPNLRNQSPLEIVRWAIVQANGRAIVSTNFRPYGSGHFAPLHAGATGHSGVMGGPRLQSPRNLPACGGFEKAAQAESETVFAENFRRAPRRRLRPDPTMDDEEGLKQFSAVMKLEPFQRGMKELAPAVWLTALRKVQNPNRAGLDIVSEDKYSVRSRSARFFILSDADMENYLKRHNLPNEWDYFDPVKADDKRECGLHANWGSQVLGSGV